jgi:SanA protein
VDTQPRAAPSPAEESGEDPIETPTGQRSRNRRRVIVALVTAGLLALVLLGGPAAWVYSTSAGHRNPQPPVSAPVGIVFGAQLRPDGTPKPYLAARLNVGVQLFRAGRVRALLVSGDAHGTSGDEVSAMTRYLESRGVPAAKLVIDPDGLDTYDTCARAVRVYGVKKALLISQDFHVPRAVTLCRHLGIDADGISAPVDDGTLRILWRNRVREIFADVKAVVDAVRNRPPAVWTPPSTAVARAVAAG